MPCEQPTFTEEELQAEEWIPIVDFGYYELSTLGQVKSLYQSQGLSRRRSKTGILLRSRNTQTGYYKVNLYKNKRQYSRDIHRLMTDHFLGPLPEGYTRNHDDGDKGNNRRSNLSFKTPQGQMDHAKSLGLTPSGDRNGSRKHPEKLPRGEQKMGSKLTDADVRNIRASTDLNRITALRHNISPSQVSNIKRRKQWQHID